MRKYILLGILLLAFVLRFIGLTKFPVGFNADEASFGYDAYSILKTGRDQWGNNLPLVFKSFGDYKSSLYGYLTIPFVAILGLTPLAVRLPNVLVGTLSVYILYLLTRKIRGLLKIGNWPLEYVASLLLAISPWSIMLSRGGFEANLLILLIPLGVYLYLTNKYLLSSFVFGLSLFSYHSAKIISPLLFVGLGILLKNKKVSSWLIYFAFILLTLFTLLNGGGARIAERSITNGALEEGAKAKILLIQNGVNPILAKLRHNKYQVVLSRFVTNYTQYLSPKFLFYQGAGEYYYGMIHGVGVLYFFEGFLLFGLFILKDNKKILKFILLLFAWTLVAILPAALSTGVGYSGHRAVGMVPSIQILASLGFYGWYLYFTNCKQNLRNIAVILMLVTMTLNIYKFINIYFKNVPDESYSQMLYGNMVFSEWISNNSQGKKVLISRSLSEPQIFLAFANKMNPSLYQNYSKKWIVETWVDQIPVYELDKYTIKSISWNEDTKNKNTMIVARPSEFPKGTIPDKSFDLPNGNPVIYVKSY